MTLSITPTQFHGNKSTREVEAIFFDVGDTLRTRVSDPTLQAQASEELYGLIQPTQPPEIFFQNIDQRYRDYQTWRRQTMIEITEQELWSRWMLPDFPAERLAPLVDRLMDLYRLRSGRPVWLEGAEKVIPELFARGYKLAIISNTISRTETPQALKDSNLTRYFNPVILSTTFGKRKPDPELFLHAARLANVLPQHCAYIGDQPTRDVVGSKRAGFALSIIIESSMSFSASDDEMLKPDLTIRQLSELLNIFPERVKK